MKSNFTFLLVLLFAISSATAQEKEELLVAQDTVKVEKTTKRIDPLSPSKAAFYSAVLPGLGQAYNKKYWKIPIVYAALGTGIYFYIDNNKERVRYRDAYKRRLQGFNDDEFWGEDADGNPLASPQVATDRLIDAQDFFEKRRDLSLLITVAIYVLNIIDANVDAHLLQYNVNDNLSVKPHFKQHDFNYRSTNVGLTFNVNF